MKNILLAVIIFVSTITVSYSQCTKANVSIDGPSVISICEGEILTLSGSALATGSSLSGGFTYSWNKLSGTVLLPPTAITLPANTSVDIPDFTINTVGITDADTYLLRIEDGNAGNASCYTEVSIVVNIDPKVITPVITSDQTICAGEEAATIGGPPAAGGSNTATASYIWESSRIGGSGWVIINGATSKDYEPGILIAQDYFRRTDIKGSCRSETSNAIKITVPTPVQISSDRWIVCQNSPMHFTANVTNGDATPLYEWFINNVSQGAPTSSPDFSAIIASSTDRIHVELANSTTTCKASSPTYIHVASPITGGTIGSDQTICYNTTPYILQTVAPANIYSIPTYTWEMSAVSSGAFVAISGATNSTLTSTPQITSDLYIRRIITDASIPSQCNVATSNTVHITVLPEFHPGSITGDEIICEGDAATIQITNVEFESGGSGTINDGYTWLVSLDGTTNWHPVPGATNAQYWYLSSPQTTTTYYKRVAYDQCNYMQQSSNIVVKTVVACNSFSAAITGTDPITPGQQNVTYSVPYQTGFTYTWAITGGTIVSGQNTNSVTVDWDNAVSSPTARTTSVAYSISVTETNQANQSKTTTLDLATLTTGVTQAQAGIKLFPNPTAGSFNIEMPESGMDVSYEVLDLTGLVVASGTFTSNGSNQNIDANFGAGMYQVILKYDNVVTSVRLSKIQ